MKKLATALTALVLISSSIGATVIATPSLAARSLGGALADCNSPGDVRSKWPFAKMAGELRDLGIKYESIDTFGNCFIVRTKNDEGGTTNMFFDPLTFARVY